MGTEENGEMSDWDPLVSMDQSLHYPFLLHNQPINTTSHLVHYQSNSNLVDMLPKITSFENNAGFPEMISSFRVSDCHPNYTHNNMVATQENCWNLEEVAGKRKSAESHTTKDTAADNSGSSKQEDEKKQKTEKDDSNYVHVRAKRGKATNSHSLAERVRREKISERMRLLQELVPGCNKVDVKKAIPRSEQEQREPQHSRGLSRNSRTNGRSDNQFSTKKIFVGGLSANLTEDEFKSYFGRFGRITDVVVMQDNVTHKPRGFGFITFSSEDAVNIVMQKNFHELSGKLVEVKRAVPKEGSRYHSYNGSGRGSSFEL